MKINVKADKDTSPKKQVFTTQLDADNWVKAQNAQGRVVMREEGQLVYFSGRDEEEIFDYYATIADPKFHKTLIEATAKIKVKATYGQITLDEFVNSWGQIQILNPPFLVGGQIEIQEWEAEVGRAKEVLKKNLGNVVAMIEGRLNDGEFSL